MTVLEKQEMINYYGGGKISTGIIAAVTGIIALIAGIVDGLTNPKACNVRR